MFVVSGDGLMSLHSSTQSSSALPLSSICLVTRSTHSS